MPIYCRLMETWLSRPCELRLRSSWIWLHTARQTSTLFLNTLCPHSLPSSSTLLITFKRWMSSLRCRSLHLHHPAVPYLGISTMHCVMLITYCYWYFWICNFSVYCLRLFDFCVVINNTYNLWIFKFLIKFGTHWYLWMSVLKTFIGGAVYWRVWIRGAGGRRNVRPCCMQQRTVHFSDVPWKWWWW